MNILPLNCLNFNNYNSVQNNGFLQQSSQFRLKMAKPISCDSVSFRATQTISKNKRAANTLGDVLKANIKADILYRLEPLSRIFFDVTNSIGEELAPFGFSFNKKYAIGGLLKSDESTWKKMLRNGDLSPVPDPIRTTLFSKDFYNLSLIFDKVIPAYAQRGFVLDPKNPDIEICMKDIGTLIEQIPNGYRFAAKGQRNSGIEQIQIRFINKSDKSKKPAKHELIIIPGYEYAKAKHYESKYIYSNTRQLNEMNFIKRGSELDQNVILARRYNELIKNLLHFEISQKIFDNAKNKDLYGINQELPINIHEKEIMLIKNYFFDVKRCMRNYYKAARERAKTSARVEELAGFYEEDLELLTQHINNIIGNPEAGVEGTLEFFNKGGYKKDPFRN